MTAVDFAALMVLIAKTVGLHEVHDAMMLIPAMGIGLFLLPLGVGYHTACAMGCVAPAVRNLVMNYQLRVDKNFT